MARRGGRRGVFGGTASAAPVPAITLVSPDLGDTGGGILVTLTGTGFTGTTSVTFGGTAGTSINVLSSTSLTVLTPAKAAGTYDVVITTPGGMDTETNGFEFWYPTQITGVSGVYDAALGVTSSGGDVSQWDDQTAVIGNLIQPTAGLKPIISPNEFGTRSGIVFSGTDSLELVAKHYQPLGRSVFAVVKWTSSDAVATYDGDAPLTIIGDYTGDVWTNFGASAGSVAFVHFTGVFTTYTGGSGLNSGNPKLIGVTHSLGTGDIKLYAGASQQGSTYNEMYFPTEEGWNNVGSGYLYQDGFVGTVGAVISVEAVISNGDLTKLNKWSMGKWGTP